MRVRIRILFVVCVCIGVTTCETLDPHVKAYIKGIQAIRASEWNQAVQEMNTAIALHKKETAAGSIHIAGESDIPYIPYYYRGLAWRALGDCVQAARDLAESRRQHESRDERRQVTRYVRDYTADVSSHSDCDMQSAVERYFRKSVLSICSLSATSNVCINSATGFLIDDSGLVLTCDHVLKRCVGTSCSEEGQTDDCLPAVGGTASHDLRGPKIRFHVVERDCEADLAILQLENDPDAKSVSTSICDVAPPPATLQGKVFALGFPEGRDGLRLMPGIITGALTQNGHLPTNVSLTWGMSGCPVFNQDGYVVAVGVGGDAHIEHANELIPLGRVAPLLRRAGVRCSW